MQREGEAVRNERKGLCAREMGLRLEEKGQIGAPESVEWTAKEVGAKFAVVCRTTRARAACSAAAAAGRSDLICAAIACAERTASIERIGYKGSFLGAHKSQQTRVVSTEVRGARTHRITNTRVLPSNTLHFPHDAAQIYIHNISLSFSFFTIGFYPQATRAPPIIRL